MAKKPILCVDLSDKPVDLSETCCTHCVDVLAQIVMEFWYKAYLNYANKAFIQLTFVGLGSPSLLFFFW